MSGVGFIVTETKPCVAAGVEALRLSLMSGYQADDLSLTDLAVKISSRYWRTLGITTFKISAAVAASSSYIRVCGDSDD